MRNSTSKITLLMAIGALALSGCISQQAEDEQLIRDLEADIAADEAEMAEEEAAMDTDEMADDAEEDETAETGEE